MKSDAQLQHDVIAELKWEPSVHATRIGVEVKDGIVTLAGHVGSFAEKLNAERAAQRVSGVVALTVEIDVALPGSAKRTGVDIARAAEHALHGLASPQQVKVMVENGLVTLPGEVDWRYERELATDSVRHLVGVRGVNDDIVIKPKVSVIAVKSDIEAALERRARADAKKMVAAVHGNEVSLSGTVHSWSERESAADSAWGTPGVRNVVNRISVAH